MVSHDHFLCPPPLSLLSKLLFVPLHRSTFQYFRDARLSCTSQITSNLHVFRQTWLNQCECCFSLPCCINTITNSNLYLGQKKRSFVWNILGSKKQCDYCKQPMANSTVAIPATPASSFFPLTLPSLSNFSLAPQTHPHYSNLISVCYIGFRKIRYPWYSQVCSVRRRDKTTSWCNSLYNDSVLVKLLTVACSHCNSYFYE